MFTIVPSIKEREKEREVKFSLKNAVGEKEMKRRNQKTYHKSITEIDYEWYRLRVKRQFAYKIHV